MKDREKEKKSRKRISSIGLRPRVAIIVVLSIVMTAVMIIRLFTLQIINGENYDENHTMQILRTKTLKPTRGEIYDVNGKLLAYNQLVYDVTMEDSGSYSSNRDHNLALNGILYNTIKVIESHGDSVSDDFQVSLNADGQYVYNVKGFNLSRFKADLFGYKTIDELSPKQVDMSAADLIALLCSDKYFGIGTESVTKADREKWNLPESYTPEEVLKLCHFRSLLQQNSYQRYNAITIASDVSSETVSQLLENTGELKGIQVTEDYKRVYNDAMYFAPIIGYTGKVSEDELKDLQQKDSSYDSTDVVGKVGLEKEMETSLQGKKGSETIFVDNLGRTLSVDSVRQPQAGDSIYLSIDANLQKVCYQILEEYIAGIVWANIVDTESINTDYITSSDQVRIPVYDVYYSLFENNVLSVSHLSNADASDNEKEVYQQFQKKAASIFKDLKSQLTSDSPTIYNDLTDEMKVYQSYIVDTMLPNAGILNTEAVDKTDQTYKSWKAGTISLKDYLSYAISRDWINIDGIVQQTSYMDSNEVYSSLADYIAADLLKDTDFCKHVFRYMLMEGSLSGAQMCMLLFDQGVLKMNEQDYNNLSDGSLSAYDFIRDKIYNLEITPAQLALAPCSGAIVVTDPSNGAVRACVTYPGYDSNRLVNEMDSDYYNKLATDLSSPFYSRATQELLAPGSTFKLVTATAALSEGVLSLGETIYCSGIFEQTEIPIKCWIYNEGGIHGTEDLVAGIKNSCNFFFNTLGYRLGSESGTYNDEDGVKKLQQYASLYGLDSKSGIEVPETSPHLLTYDAVRGAMGQSDNAYTVSELARYVTTIANSGSCYDLSLISKTTDSNGNTVTEHEPKLHSQVSMPQEDWDAIHEGMKQVVQNSSAFTGYKGVSVSGKTGTAQEVVTKPNHALFVGYAPSDKPTMALAVRVANGYSSANTAALAKDVVNYYFNQKDLSELTPGHAIQVQSGNTRND
ncbi:MAG: penicillin-binding transpeptidase domain-containing protein [Lachnospiraceae bacterium]|nr:penicillin-binding transpeptidase domain-containing protein [Lachnospiraceae bacterium]